MDNAEGDKWGNWWTDIKAHLTLGNRYSWKVHGFSRLDKPWRRLGSTSHPGGTPTTWQRITPACVSSVRITVPFGDKHLSSSGNLTTSAFLYLSLWATHNNYFLFHGQFFVWKQLTCSPSPPTPRRPAPSLWLGFQNLTIVRRLLDLTEVAVIKSLLFSSKSTPLPALW